MGITSAHLTHMWNRGISHCSKWRALVCVCLSFSGKKFEKHKKGVASKQKDGLWMSLFLQESGCMSFSGKKLEREHNRDGMKMKKTNFLVRREGRELRRTLGCTVWEC